MIEPVDGLVTHANDFEAGGARACRSRRLLRILEGKRPAREGLFEALRDHDPGSPEHICSHPVSRLTTQSIASIVLECLPEPTLWVAKGVPCVTREPVSYRFSR